MATRWQFGSKKRDYLYSRCRNEAGIAGLGNHPICNICHQPVLPTDAWDESHAPEHPKALGGKSVAIAHLTCNRDHGAKVVVPLIAKVKRTRDKFLGIKGPGLGRHPMQGGRRSGVTRTMSGEVKPRLTLAQKHAQFLQRRAIIADPVENSSDIREVRK